MSAINLCQCAKDGLPCTYRPTQEDLLCDHCRAGCAVVVSGTVPVHVNNTGTLDAAPRLQEAVDLGDEFPAMKPGRYLTLSVIAVP